MTFQPGAMVYTQSFGSRPENVEVPHYDRRVPASSDILYPIGKIWIYPGDSIWQLIQLSSSGGITTASWVQLAAPGGAVQVVLGTASEITVTTLAGTSTISLPNAITTPGSLETTTTLTAGTGLTVSAGGAAITGNSTVTGDLDVTGDIDSGTAITAGTTITATLGDITATDGNLVLGTAGNKIEIATGANASVGTSAAMTAGSVTVANTSVTANSIIFAVPAVLGTVTAPQAYYISAIVAATSFTITSADATDTSTWNYWIIN